MKEIKTPEECLTYLKNQITKTERVAFYAAIAMGLMTHIYALVNKLYNYDELPSTPGGFIGAGNNRWFLEITGKLASRFLGGSYSLPFLSGIITILLVALSALLVVRMFEIKSTFFAACIGGFMVTFPAVTSLLFFMFLAPNYAVGIFLSVLAAYMLVRHPKKIWGNILAIIFLACATGTYQAYFPDTVCLLVMSIVLLSAFDEEKNWREIFWLAVRYVVVLALGMVLYFVLNKFFLNVWGTSSALGGYQGLDTMGQISIAELVGALGDCYKSFVALGFENVADINNNGLLMKGFRVATLILVLGIGAVLALKKGEWQKKFFMVAGVCVFPMAMFLTYVMAPDAKFYTLMGYAVVFLLIFAVVWVEYFYFYIEKAKVFATLMQWAAAAMSVVMLAVFIWYGNGSYMAMEYTKMHDLAYFETMVTQIKSLDGYSDELPLIVVGTKVDDATNGAGSLIGDVFTIDGKSESHVGRDAAIYLITKYLGFAPEIGGYEETVEWMQRDEVRAMSSYPDAGSIQIIDDTIIVKLGEYE